MPAQRRLALLRCVDSERVDTAAEDIIVATRDKTGPEINYPALWGYRIVGTCEDEIRAHVLELLAGVEHELVLGRHSSGGRYVSLHLSLVVQDEAQRLAVYEHIVRHEAVRFVV